MANKKLALIPLLLFLTAGAALAQQPQVTSPMSKDLTDMPGKEGLMITVEYPPGASDPIHRHNAQAFVYVLEGSVVMQLKGGKQVTLTPGQTFYEGTDDVHLVGRNASTTKPAKFPGVPSKEQGSSAIHSGKMTVALPDHLQSEKPSRCMQQGE
jgi:quercetin dioxygenase-like cupin family protein